MPTIRFSARAWPRRWRWRRVRCGFSASRSVADTGGWEGGGHGGLSAFGLETCPRSWARVGDGGVYLCGWRRSSWAGMPTIRFSAAIGGRSGAGWAGHMVSIGKRNQLKVLKSAPPGFYLDGGPLGEVLLPGALVPTGAKVGDV